MSLPRQHSVLVLLSGRSKVENFLALVQALSLSRLCLPLSRPHRGLAGLHVRVGRKSCHVQIVKEVVVMQIMMIVTTTTTMISLGSLFDGYLYIIFNLKFSGVVRWQGFCRGCFVSKGTFLGPVACPCPGRAQAQGQWSNFSFDARLLHRSSLPKHMEN